MVNKFIAASIVSLAIGQVHAAIPVTSEGPLSNSANLLNQALSPEKRAQLQQAGMELQVMSGQIDTGTTTYCYARIGVSYPEVKGRNSRLASVFIPSFHRVPQGSPVPECLEVAADNAMKEFNKMSWNELVPTPQALSTKGGTRPNDPANEGTYRVVKQGIDAATNQFINNTIEKSPIPLLFDYRHVQTSVDVSIGEFDDVLVCVARAGLTARSPTDRQPRRPSRYGVGGSVVPLKQGESQCRVNAVNDALTKLLSAAWDQQGVLGDFAAAREDGVPQPDARAVANKYAGMNRPPATAPAPATKQQQQTAVKGLTPACRDFFKHYPNGWVPSTEAEREYGMDGGEEKEAAMFNLNIACNAQKRMSH